MKLLKHPSEYIFTPVNNAIFRKNGCGPLGCEVYSSNKKYYDFPRWPGLYCVECAFSACEGMALKAMLTQKAECAKNNELIDPFVTHDDSYRLEDVTNVSEEAMNILYELVHKRSGKKYIGYSTVGTKRFHYHELDCFVNNDQRELYRDMRVDSIAGFEWNVLRTFPDTAEGLAEMKDAEKREIAKYVNAGIRVYNGMMTVRWSYGPNAGPEMDNEYIIEKKMVDTFAADDGHTFDENKRRTPEQKAHQSRLMTARNARKKAERLLSKEDRAKLEEERSAAACTLAKAKEEVLQQKHLKKIAQQERLTTKKERVPRYLHTEEELTAKRLLLTGKVVELRAQDRTFGEIADLLGISKAGAHRLFMRSEASRTEQLVTMPLFPESLPDSALVTETPVQKAKRSYIRHKQTIAPRRRFTMQEKKIIVLLVTAKYAQWKIGVLLDCNQSAVSKVFKKMSAQ